MFEDLNDFRETLKALIKMKTKNLCGYTQKVIKDLEHEISIDCSNFINSLIKTYRLINSLNYFYKQNERESN